MRTLYYLSGFQAPAVHWRDSQQSAFQASPMRRAGPGRTAWENLWEVTLPSSHPIEFYIEDCSGRDPLRRHYECATNMIFLQDGQLYAYRPASQVDGPRRAYDPANVPQVFSKILNEHRRVRVYLPRGYRQHGRRRYPVVYFQDGQNIFDGGSFGTWNAADNLDRLTARGKIEEVIAVAIDHGDNRLGDYIPPEDGGRSDLYARFLVQELKPWVDATFRTRTEPNQTAILGSSLGAVAATYVAWEHFHAFGKVGSLSGSWWLKGYQNRLLTGRRLRPVKLYIDCGDSGPYCDSIHHTQALVGELERLGLRAGKDFQFFVGEGQSHTEEAWGSRLKHVLQFFFPLVTCEEERLSLPLELRIGA